MGRNAEDDYTSTDLSVAPEAPLPVDPMANSTAMLGAPTDGTSEVSPEEAGPAGSLAFLGMMVQGAQGLSANVPGFVPMEITQWLQGAMQQLPQMLQSLSSGVGMQGPGAAMPGQGGGGMMAMLGAPSGPAPAQAGPSRPPRPSY